MMRLKFSSRKINVGDHLNEWLWPKLIDDFSSQHNHVAFLGIGTIITPKRLKEIDHDDSCSRAIIFSSGTWENKPLRLNKKWITYGVRGPKTAQNLGLDNEAVIGDGAYLLRNFYPISPKTGTEIGFIPHHTSELFVDWSKVCAKAGLKYITPKQNIESFIEELYLCKSVITEAMHGAIISDALRIPWKAIQFSPRFEFFKWYDWAEALNLKLDISPLPFTITNRIPAGRMVEDFMKWQARKILTSQKSKRINVYKEKKDRLSANVLIKELLKIKTLPTQLSDEDSCNQVIENLNYAVSSLNKDLRSERFSVNNTK